MARATTTPKTDDIVEQLDTLRADVAELTQIVSQVATAKAESAAASVKKRVDEQVHSISDTASQFSALAEESVRRQPVAATAIAAGLGFMIGYLANRK